MATGGVTSSAGIVSNSRKIPLAVKQRLNPARISDISGSISCGYVSVNRPCCNSFVLADLDSPILRTSSTFLTTRGSSQIFNPFWKKTEVCPSLGHFAGHDAPKLNLLTSHFEMPVLNLCGAEVARSRALVNL